MNVIADNLMAVRNRIMSAEKEFERKEGEVCLLAVSKTKPLELIEAAILAGQTCFGENYVQEAVSKITTINNPAVEWHFIGPIQSNKTRLIAAHFSWVHSVDRVKIAERLNEQRPENLKPLNICLQVNISDESTKSGVLLSELPVIIEAVKCLPRLNVRGLMAIPSSTGNFCEQRSAFQLLRDAAVDLSDKYSIKLDTLSMGMSNDLEAAIAEGATIVRVGTDIFGARTAVN